MSRSLTARPREPDRATEDAGITLWWLPVGAGGHVVKHTSHWWEVLAALRDARAPQPLFHSALEVVTHGQRYLVEMAPDWGGPKETDRGVVATGPVGLRAGGRCRLFRYQVRCWHNGDLPDRNWAVGGPVIVTHDEATAQSLLRRVPEVPHLTWGRQVPATNDMCNSNSLVSWLLAGVGVPVGNLPPPMGGRAPGWIAGIAVAAAHHEPADTP